MTQNRPDNQPITLEWLFAQSTPIPHCGCWVWDRALSPAGYGVVRYDGRMRRTHDVSYILHYGDIPVGLEPDHLCRVRSCINPLHLEAVTHKENMRRSPYMGTHLIATNSTKIFCPSGHPYAGSNLYITPTGTRQCVKCKRLRVIESRARIKKRAETIGDAA